MSSTTRNTIVKFLVLIAAFTSLFAIQTQSASAASYMTAEWQVVYKDGYGRYYSVPGATVTFSKNGKVTSQQTTDSNGWVRVSALRGTSFQISVSRVSGPCWVPGGQVSWRGSYNWNVPTGGASLQRGQLVTNYSVFRC